jgi:hypothetical protein
MVVRYSLDYLDNSLLYPIFAATKRYSCMEPSMHLPKNYMSLLLLLSDEAKVRVINKLLRSLVKMPHRTKVNQIVSKTKGESLMSGSTSNVTFKHSTIDFINTLSLTGGKVVPGNVNNIDSLLLEKYL